MTPEKVEFMGWPNCLRLSNESCELIVATDIGLRLLRFGFTGGQNLLHLEPSQLGATGGSEWRIYGGHRLWHAPEAMPRSYSPDNEPVQFTAIQDGVRITQQKENATGIEKEMDITLSNDRNYATVVHRLVNHNLWAVELAPWALSVLGPGGMAIIPQEPYGPADTCLLPVRAVALWPFTHLGDPRWTWGRDYIFATHQSAQTSEQKIGVTNTPGWMAYCLGGEVLIKSFDYQPDAVYPDFHCNMEVYIDGRFLELETLGPLSSVPPGKSVEHTEHWLLDKMPHPRDESDVTRDLLPRVKTLFTFRG